MQAAALMMPDYTGIHRFTGGRVPCRVRAKVPASPNPFLNSGQFRNSGRYRMGFSGIIEMITVE